MKPKRKSKTTRCDRLALREAKFFRGILKLVAEGPRKTRDQRMAASALSFWDTMQDEKQKRQRP